MITISAQPADLSALSVDVVAVGVFKGGIEGPGTSEVLRLLGLDRFPTTPAFRGQLGQVLRLAAPGQPFRSVLLVGLGRMDGVSPATLRLAAGEITRACPKAGRIATTLAEVHPTRDAIEAVADGLALGAFTDQRFRSAPEPRPDQEAILLLPSSLIGEARAAIERSATTTAAVTFARELVNTPPAQATPAAIAEQVAASVPDQVEVAVRDERWLAEHGCGGLLGVGRGSANPPRLVELTWSPINPVAHVVVAGKGITFDTGGMNLKPAEGMPAMKADMAGAAAVGAAMGAVATLRGRVAVTGLLALAENAIGGDAQRPSDVITTFDGTTVEVLHTDAEGRLVLADALGYAASLEPDAIIDLATLTGGAITALGPYTAALMANDDGLAADVLEAAAQAGESVWRLPLPDELDASIESRVADIDNLGMDRKASPIMGGLFLQRFVAGIPWAHLDIAGPAFLDAGDARGHTPAGGTGFGVTTLLSFVQRHGG